MLDRRFGGAARWAFVLCGCAALGLACSGGGATSGSDGGVAGSGGGSAGGGSAGNGSGGTPAPIGMLDIGTAHPRLWFTPARLELARAWAAQNPIVVGDEGEQDVLAFKYLVTGDRALARQAIDWAKNFTLDVSRTVNDDARWAGERVLLVYDWCHDQWTEEERRAFTTRWNGYVDELNKKFWGSAEAPGPANNYFWGYLRNGIEWAITSWHENPEAPRLLAHALDVRWKALVAYGEKGGAGGVPGEGSQYGRYMLGYAAVPLTTARLLGRDLWNETPLFKQSVFYLASSLTMAPTLRPDGKTSSYEVFPYSDDDSFRSGGSASSIDTGAFLATAIDVWKDSAVAGYARHYLDLVKPPIPPYIRAVMPEVKAREFSSLPLDYFAAGNAYVYARSAWKGDATQLNLQLRLPQGADHGHLDAGTFQLWRGGRWLSRETAGYGNNCELKGYSGQGSVGCAATVAHNGLLFEGDGLARSSHEGQAEVLRLRSEPDYLYAAVDLGPVFRSTSDRVERDHNVNADRAVREFLFVRPLETLVVVDRMKASSKEKAAADVTRTFLLHGAVRPTVDGQAATFVTGDQTLRALTLAPASASHRVVEEGDNVGQFRLEVDARGADPLVFIHVLQARASAGADVQASLDEGGDGYTITLEVAGKGKATIELGKGMDGVGGAFGFAASGSPTTKPLPAGVQGLSVGDDGPRWVP